MIYFKMSNPFCELTKFEWVLWIVSMVVVGGCNLLAGEGRWMNMVASLVGVTSLIFIAKGYVIGQLLMIVFSCLYGIISYVFAYYGELITYVFMTAPMAVGAAIEWYRHPFQGTREVAVNRLEKSQILLGVVLSGAVTVLFYFILQALDTTNLGLSTLSITTTFFAAYLTYLRSPYCTLAYGLNDVVLIVLWILATAEDFSYLPMVLCFVMFLFNDVYGFYSWRRMQRRQEQ